MGHNWEWSFNHGREQRLKREREAAEQGIAECDVDRSVPLHSRDGTMQSQFKKGMVFRDAIRDLRRPQPSPLQYPHHLQRQGRRALCQAACAFQEG
ncbi:hypothetical protein [Aeromonas veronii]|uniref:hypothetical protein n=1 Tax=Aeromonas veronii TaxID=654 RepID=UPI0024446849|nr:hypothetical protein [Aeromonas veronii]